MMKSGEYYIGDLCYVFDRKEWDQVLETTDFADGEFTLPDGRCFAMYGTSYGDGVYGARNIELGVNYALGVDSGTIGCILVQDITRVTDRTELLDLGAIVEFTTDFHTHGTGGDMYFGHVHVDTTGDDEEDETTDEDEYDEEDETTDEDEYDEEDETTDEDEYDEEDDYRN